MIAVALKQTGSKAVVISTDRLFQGTDAETIFVLSPFTYGNPIQISATLPDGTNLGYNPCEPMPSVADHLPPIPMSPGDLPADYLENISVWKYDPPTTWANKAGRLYINFAVLGKKEKVVYTHNEGQQPTVTRQAVDCYLTTQMCELTIEEAALPVLDNGNDNVAEIAYEDVLRYLSDIYTSVATIESDLNDEGGIKDRLNAAEGNIESIEGVLDAADSAPTQGSNDLVKSGGTYTAIKDAKDESIAYTNEKFAQITGGVDVVTGVKGSAESSYRTGDVSLDKEDIGLGNVDNTSDLDKPVSTAQQTAIDGKVSKKPDGTNDLINDNNKVNNVYLPDFLLGQVLYGGTFAASTATATLSTNAKSKLGTSDNTIVLTNDTTAVTGYVANEGIYYIATDVGTFAGLSIVTGDWLISNGSAWAKIDNTDAVQSVAGKTGAVVLDKSDVGLGNVDNTSDMDKPVSTAQQTALNAKQNTLTFDSTPTAGSNNPVTSDGIYTAILTGGSGLSVDSVPTGSSQNLVTSDGVAQYTNGRVYKNVFYDLGITETGTFDDLVAAMASTSTLCAPVTNGNYLPVGAQVWNGKYKNGILYVAKSGGVVYFARYTAFYNVGSNNNPSYKGQRTWEYRYNKEDTSKSGWVDVDYWRHIDGQAFLDTLTTNSVGVPLPLTFYFNAMTDGSTYYDNFYTGAGAPSPTGEYGFMVMHRYTSTRGTAMFYSSESPNIYASQYYYDTSAGAYKWSDWRIINKPTVYIHRVTISDVGIDLHFSYMSGSSTAVTTMADLLDAVDGKYLDDVRGMYYAANSYYFYNAIVGSSGIEAKYGSGANDLITITSSSTYSIAETVSALEV